MHKDSSDRLERQRFIIEWLSSETNPSTNVSAEAYLEERFNSLMSALHKETNVVELKPRRK